MGALDDSQIFGIAFVSTAAFMVAIFVVFWFFGRRKRRRLAEHGLAANGRAVRVERVTMGDGSADFTDVAWVDNKGNEHETSIAGRWEGQLSLLYDPTKPDQFVVVEGSRVFSLFDRFKMFSMAALILAIAVFGLGLLLGYWTIEDLPG